MFETFVSIFKELVGFPIEYLFKINNMSVEPQRWVLVMTGVFTLFNKNLQTDLK